MTHRFVTHSSHLYSFPASEVYTTNPLPLCGTGCFCAPPIHPPALPYSSPCCPAALPSCPPRSCTLRPAPIRPPALPPSRSYTLPEDIPEGHVTLASPIMPADGGALVYDFVYDVQQDK